MRPSTLTQTDFVRQSGESAVLTIRPARVAMHTGTKWPVSKARLRKLHRVLPRALTNLVRPAIKRREPFVIPPRYFGTPHPMTETPRYLRVADFIRRPGSVEDTAWFRDLAEELAATGAARHKDIIMRSREDIHGFFDTYVIPMIDSLRRDGFDTTRADFDSVAVIDANGRLTKAGSGNHRFAICQVLDSPSFPLRVVAVHADWYARAVMAQGDSWESLFRALKAVERDHQ